MASTLPADGLSSHSGRTADWYGGKQHIFPTRWLTPLYQPPCSRNGNACFERCVNDSDILSDEGTVTESDIDCCSYRAKTSEKAEGYKHLHQLTFRQLYMGLVRNTTAHGLPHIHAAHGCVKRTFWSVLTLFLIGIWLWNSHSVLSSFLQYGVTVSYDIRLAHEVQFPAVTICNQNVARSSKLNRDPNAKGILQRRAHELFRNSGSEPLPVGRPGPRQDPGSVGGAPRPGSRVLGSRPAPGRNGPGGAPGEPSLRGSQPTVAAGGSRSGSLAGPGSVPVPDTLRTSVQARKHVPGGLARERNELSQRKVLIQEFLIGLDPETRADYGHQFDPLISDAQYSGYEVYNTTFKASYDLSYGNCFTFNTGANGTEESLFASNTGPDYGLTLMFVIEEDEYIGEITYKQGLRVVIHNPASPPFPAEQGMDVTPGKSTSIGVRKVTIKRLGGDYNKCVNMSASHADINVYEELYDWTAYTIIGCQKTCYQQAVMNTCGCFDHDFPAKGKAFSQIISVGVCSYANETQDDCKSTIYEQLRNGKLLCNQCQKPCTEEYFDTSISSAMWPAKKYIPTLRELYEDNPYISSLLNSGPHHGNIGLLEVYFESLNLEEMNEQPAYDTSQFIADIGGTIGLWVGASMMTIFEFGEFFLDAFVLFLAKCFRCNKGEHNDRRRKHVRAVQQNNHDLRLKRVYHHEIDLSYSSSRNVSRAGSAGVFPGDWIKSDNTNK